MKQIHSLRYKDGEEWKMLTYGDIIETTEPDAVKAPEPEALKLLMEEPVTITVTMAKKAMKKLRRIFAQNQKEELRQRLRAAKRRNRQRRLEQYKNAKTYHGAIRAAIREYITWLMEPVIFSPADGIIDFEKACERLQLAQPNATDPVIYIFDKNDMEQRNDPSGRS